MRLAQHDLQVSEGNERARDFPAACAVQIAATGATTYYHVRLSMAKLPYLAIIVKSIGSESDFRGR